jgi:hypothetical protein
MARKTPKPKLHAADLPILKELFLTLTLGQRPLEIRVFVAILSAFSTGEGLWQFSHDLWPLQSFFDVSTVNGESFLVYLYEVIVIGRTVEEHVLTLRKVFQRFQEARLKLNPAITWEPQPTRTQQLKSCVFC